MIDSQNSFNVSRPYFKPLQMFQPQTVTQILNFETVNNCLHYDSCNTQLPKCQFMNENILFGH